MSRPLTVRELMVLDVERSWWKYAGAKEAHIREHLGMSPVRYYQSLNALMDRPEAMVHDAMLVKRLRRLRDQRRATRRRNAS
jgi:hypothetical protein